MPLIQVTSRLRVSKLFNFEILFFLFSVFLFHSRVKRESELASLIIFPAYLQGGDNMRKGVVTKP